MRMEETDREEEEEEEEEEEVVVVEGTQDASVLTWRP